VNVYVDNPKLMVMKNETKALAFSVILMTDQNEPVAIVPNFRLMDGMLNPPASYSKRLKQYYPALHLGPEAADSVFEQLRDSGWIERYEVPELEPRARAVQPLLVTTEVLRQRAPHMVGV
jgi:hypothetical protein